MTYTEIIAVGCVLVGVAFFVAGTVGLLRFPDVYCRLHALTKADNVGLALIVMGLLLRLPPLAIAFKLLLIWLFVMLASATCSYLIARAALDSGVKPWRKRP